MIYSNRKIFMNIPKYIQRWPWDIILITLLALVLRLVMLDLRAPHFDEGINGWFVDQMRATGTFRYSPENFHGPWHFYNIFLSQELLGRNLWALRIPTVIASVLTVPVIFLFGRWFGRIAIRWAALAFAVSTAGTFYGRYAIHESWFVLFIILFTWGAIALWQDRDKAGLWAFIIGLTGMLLNKETYIIHVGSLILAAIVFILWNKLVPIIDSQKNFPKRTWSNKDAWIGSIIAIFVLIFFYSGNFLYFEGILGPFQAIVEWTKTGNAGNGHEKAMYDILPFVNYYWLALITRYEWPVLIGLIWSIRYMWTGTAVPRLLAILGIGVLLAYSIIPYKTPWCIITIIWPWFIFFGIAVESSKRKWIKIFAIVVLIASLTQAIRLNFFNFESDYEPYVYVHSYNSLYDFTDPLVNLAKSDSSYYQTKGAIYLESYYPLPWILGDFKNIGYYGGGTPYILPDVQFYVVERKNAELLRKFLGKDYVEVSFKLRSGVDDCIVFFNTKLSEAMNRAK